MTYMLRYNEKLPLVKIINLLLMHIIGINSLVVMLWFHLS